MEACEILLGIFRGLQTRISYTEGNRNITGILFIQRLAPVSTSFLLVECEESVISEGTDELTEHGSVRLVLDMERSRTL